MQPIYISILQEQKYKRGSDIQLLLLDFYTTFNQIKACNGSFLNTTLLMFLRGALKNTESLPTLGIDRTCLVDPKTWLDKQHPVEIDALDKLKAKHYSKYHIKGDEGKKAIIKWLERLYPNYRKTGYSVKDLIAKFQDIIVFSDLSTYFINPILFKKILL